MIYSIHSPKCQKFNMDHSAAGPCQASKQGLVYWTPLRDFSSLWISTLSPAVCWTWHSRASRGPEVRGSDLDITPSLITQGHHMLVSNHGQEDNSERGKVWALMSTADCVSLLHPESMLSIYIAIVPFFGLVILILYHSTFAPPFLIPCFFFPFSIFALLNVFLTTVVSPSPFPAQFSFSIISL